MSGTAKIVTIEINKNCHADIIKGKSVRFYGTAFGKEIDRTFVIGDEAEYDSFNLCYFGIITQITDKTICMVPSGRRLGKKRLKILNFFYRNWDFDAEFRRNQNEIIRQCL